MNEKVLVAAQSPFIMFDADVGRQVRLRTKVLRKPHRCSVTSASSHTGVQPPSSTPALLVLSTGKIENLKS
jgi:hypothetical protein